MKNFVKYLLFASLMLIAGCSNSAKQKDTTNANTLKSESLHPLRNGFSIFSLGSHIKNYNKSVKLVKKAFHKAYYEVTDSNLLKVNEGLKVSAITLGTWDDHINLIDVTVLEPYKEKFLDLLINAYGNRKKEPGELLYTWYFRDPRLLVVYNLDEYGSKKAVATFIRSIGKTEPNHELVEEAKSNLEDI